jgi:hypothetical protein
MKEVFKGLKKKEVLGAAHKEEAFNEPPTCNKDNC